MSRHTWFALAALLAGITTGCNDDDPAKTDSITQRDTGAKDTGAKDTGAKDTGAKDTGAKDTGAKDTGATSDSAEATEVIGAAGGAMDSSDGKLTLEIPAGALSGNVTFTIAKIAKPASAAGMTALTSTVNTTAKTVSVQTNHTSIWCLCVAGDAAPQLLDCCYEITDTSFSVDATIKLLYETCPKDPGLPVEQLKLCRQMPLA